jgi:hypothetical protein
MARLAVSINMLLHNINSYMHLVFTGLVQNSSKFFSQPSTSVLVSRLESLDLLFVALLIDLA